MVVAGVPDAGDVARDAVVVGEGVEDLLGGGAGGVGRVVEGFGEDVARVAGVEVAVEPVGGGFGRGFGGEVVVVVIVGRGVLGQGFCEDFVGGW